MRRIATIFFLPLISLTASAQKIRGLVTDSSGAILPYASVFIRGENKGTHANTEGKYVLTLLPGSYTVVCQYVGYRKTEKTVTVGAGDQEINFSLVPQDMTLGEVVLKNGEDPAYAIIRNTIRKKSYYQAQLDKFQCEVYTKGQLRVRNYPKKFLGQKVDFEDGDTSKQKMIYLSETIARYSVDKPHEEKVEVVSSKVSGQSDAYGLSAPRFFPFYDNNIPIGNNLNPRGFISPVADNALNYYRYKLEGTFFEDGRMVNHIRVTPKRNYEPLFSGTIDIIDGDWRIHSLKLMLTKASQMEWIDTLRIEQLYRPLSADTWFISSQVIYPSIKIFGFDAYGSFINIYSDCRLDPAFTKKTFGRTVLKYLDSANKKTAEYWENARPVPLLADEERDYRRKDSLELARKDPRYLDSLDRIRNKTSLPKFILFGQTFVTSRKRVSFSISPLIEEIAFNPAEGWVLQPSMTWSKRLDSNSAGRRSIALTANVRYGFSNRHFNSNLTAHYVFGKKYASSFRLSGGTRVFQFNNNSPIGERGNTLSCLLSEENRIKSYEATYLRGSFRKGIGEGFGITLAFQWQDRRPLENTTDFTWRNKAGREYTPNYPSELMNANIRKHQAFFILAGLRWQPGTRYVELPDRKMNIGSRFPVFNLQYMQGFRHIWGSDVSFSKWRLGISDNINFHLYGRFRYRLSIGGFLDTGHVQTPDYNHFNGNISTFATEYLNSFQLLPIYQFSNTARFYSIAHIEHNFNGFLTNKIPGVKRLNVYLVTGLNGFYINGSKNYYELFAGIDNIFKQLRVDFVQSFLRGRAWQNGIRIGLRIFGGGRGDDWP